jgi:hypothetical protein
MKYVRPVVLVVASLFLMVAASGCFEGVSRDIGSGFSSIGRMFVEAGSK